MTFTLLFGIAEERVGGDDGDDNFLAARPGKGTRR